MFPRNIHKFIHTKPMGLLFITAFFLFGCCSAEEVQTSPHDISEVQPEKPMGEYSPQEAVLIEQYEPSPATPSRAEKVIKAISSAYSPFIVGPAVYQNGDWTVTVRGQVFYYAEGRMLPENLRDTYEEYDPQPFYRYPEKLPPWKPLDETESASLRSITGRRRENPPKRSNHFFDALYRSSSRNESYERMKTLRLLGREVLVHYNILEQLSLVEEEIQRISQTNAEVRTWVANIKTITGWNWRSIAETDSRSFHSYGVALDFLPNSLRGLSTYWLWTADWNPEWWNVSYSQRFHPPEPVIESFEKYGFIWGGKWMFFDTMHFEYRPEILVLNDIKMAEYR